MKAQGRRRGSGLPLSWKKPRKSPPSPRRKGRRKKPRKSPPSPRRKGRGKRPRRRRERKSWTRLPRMRRAPKRRGWNPALERAAARCRMAGWRWRMRAPARSTTTMKAQGRQPGTGLLQLPPPPCQRTPRRVPPNHRLRARASPLLRRRRRRQLLPLRKESPHVMRHPRALIPARRVLSLRDGSRLLTRVLAKFTITIRLMRRLHGKGQFSQKGLPQRPQMGRGRQRSYQQQKKRSL
mmetsp:Transcript_21709/g.63861  ORF Transcript_21709/g.63861 Transcript_21709/m.63861 type:complete len:237 (+) Transcript_21709:1975-2685(+)